MRTKNTVIAAVIAAAAVGGVALAQSSSSSSSSSQRQYDRSSNDRSSSSYDRSSRRSSDRDRSSRSSSSSHYSSRRDSGSSSGSGVTGGSTTRPADFLEQYRLVLDRNIFSRTRVIYRESATTQPVVSGGPYFVQPALALTGVTREEGHSAGPVVAFIEDRRTGRTTGYKVGETIADSGQRITAINLDSIEYVGKDGRAVRVELGHTLEGGPTYVVSSSYGGSATSPSTSGYGSSGSTSGGVSGGSTTGSGSSGSGDSSDILEKLRQRRLQETKR